MKTWFVEQVKWVGVIALLLALGGFLVLISSNQDLTKYVDSVQDQISALDGELAALRATVAKYNTDTQAQFNQRAETLQEIEERLSSRLDTVESNLAALRQKDFAKLSEAVGGLEADISNIRQQELPPVHDKLTELETLFVSSHPLKVAYINAEDAFTVFTDAVGDLRQRAIDKQGEIVKLQQQYMASTISKDDFDSQNNQLQVELLQAQLNIDLGTIDKMIASSGFSDMKSDLQRLKDEAQPVVDEMKNLVSTVRVGVIDTTEFQNRYTQVKNAFTQLDQLLTKAATAKIVQAANNVAVDQGYDLVLRTKNVIVYRNTAKMTDITDIVKRDLSATLNRYGDPETTEDHVDSETPSPPNYSPIARFTQIPSSGEAPLKVLFDASTSSDPDGSIVSYAWSFGDGGTGSGIIISHTYISAGTYTAWLTATDNDGGTDTVTHSSLVQSPTPTPVRRIGAICKDGWRSSATGSGACSHHGGVAYWLYSD